MNAINRILLALAVLAAAALACEYVPGSTPAEGTKTPGGEVIYQDDFSNTSSGWTTWKQENSEVAYEAGGLSMRIKEPSYDYWARPGKRFLESRIEVDATKIGGPDNNDFGLICRYRNGDNFYGFFASSDGYFGIVRVKDGEYLVLGADKMQYSEALKKGSATNHLRGDCVGNTLTFYINGTRLVQARDDTFESGEVGVLAGTYDQPGVEILFDNFIVFKP